MAARAIWKGVLKIGRTRIPVKLYAAVQDRDVHFHILDKETKKRIRQGMVSQEERSEVETPEIQKGYEYERGKFVVLGRSDLERLKPKESREIQSTRFVPSHILGPEWFERPYYLAPDGETSNYFALAAALERSLSVGIETWTMRGKSYVGALQPTNGYLALIKLRYSDEVIPADKLHIRSQASPNSKELQMAEQLVSALEDSFRPEDYRDEYRDRLMEWIQARARGKHRRLPAVKGRTVGSTSMESQLARSLAAVGA